MLIASAYSGFIVWHGGLAGSIPLVIATDGHFTANVIGVIGTGETIFAFFNLAIIVALFIVVPLVNRMMLPSEEESVYVDPAILDDGPDTSVAADNHGRDHQRGPYLALRVHQPKTGGTSVAPGFVQGLWKIATSFRGTVIVQPRRSATSASVASR